MNVPPAEAACSTEPRPPTLEEVLAEIEPFLRVIDYEGPRDPVRKLVSIVKNFEGLTNDEMSSRICPGFGAEMLRRATYYPMQSEYSDVQRHPPSLPSEIYANRSTPVIAELIRILRFALGEGISHSGEHALYTLTYKFAHLELKMGYTNSGEVGRREVVMEFEYISQVLEELMKEAVGVRGLVASEFTLYNCCHAPSSIDPASCAGRMFDAVLTEVVTNQIYSLNKLVSGGYFHVWQVRRLLESGVSPNAGDEKGNTLLHTRVRADRLEPNQLIYFHVNTSVLQIGCAEVGEIIMLLINAGANVNAVNEDGDTPLHSTVHFLQTSEYLIAAGADIHAKNKHGEQPVHKAAALGCLGGGGLECLIKAGADVNSTSAGHAWFAGRTPLEYAVEEGGLSVVEYLLAAGAVVDSDLIRYCRWPRRREGGAKALLLLNACAEPHPNLLLHLGRTAFEPNKGVLPAGNRS